MLFQPYIRAGNAAFIRRQAGEQLYAARAELVLSGNQRIVLKYKAFLRKRIAIDDRKCDASEFQLLNRGPFVPQLAVKDHLNLDLPVCFFLHQMRKIQCNSRIQVVFPGAGGQSEDGALAVGLEADRLAHDSQTHTRNHRRQQTRDNTEQPCLHEIPSFPLHELTYDTHYSVQIRRIANRLLAQP